jgi:POT family proton-dependent oligopeptide transporter
MTDAIGQAESALPPQGARDASWFGHPRQLARLFTTEAMERFGYYGMRALLTLYLAQHFLFSDTTTAGLYGGFTALVYLTPLIGGLMADRFLGSKRSVKFGAILMSLGYVVLCLSSTGGAAKPFALIEGQRYDVTVSDTGDARKQYVSESGAALQIKGNDDKSVSLLRADGSEARRIAPGKFEPGGQRNPLYTLLLITGLAFVTVGNGFFKPNISTIVGELYEQGDRRRDAGFTIFYMGINLGSLFSQILCPLLAVGMGAWGGLGWWAGFALAAAGMAVSWLLFQFDGGKLDGFGERPEHADGGKDILVYVGALAVIPLIYLLFANLMAYVRPEEGSGFLGYIATLPIMGKVMFGTFIVAIPGILIWSWRNGSPREFQMMVAAIVLITFNTVFWTLFEQAGSSLTLFADRNTDMSVFGLRGLFEHDVVPEPVDALERLVSAGVRPVLAVAEEFRPIRRVLVAYSGSIESAKTYKHFVQSGLYADAAVRIVHFGHDEATARRRLEKSAGYFAAHGREVDTDHCSGDAANELVPYAQAWKADLIVAGNSSKNLLLRKLFGETALKLLRESPLPLYLAQ